MLRGLLEMVAVICIGLGFIGAFLPVLPHTFSHSGYCIEYNSEPRHRKWLLEHPVFGKTIENYLEQRSISPVALHNALVTLQGCLLLNFWLVDRLYSIIFKSITTDREYILPTGMNHLLNMKWNFAMREKLLKLCPLCCGKVNILSRN